MRGLFWGGPLKGLALVPVRTPLTPKPFRVTLKGLGPMPIGHSPNPFRVTLTLKG